MNRIKFFILICVSAVLVVSACRKTERDSDTDISVSQDVLLADIVLDDLLKQVHSAVLIDSLKGLPSNLSLMEVGIDTFSLTTGLGNGFPKELTLNFGTIGNTCSDANIRKGIIKAKFTDNYMVAGGKVEITPVGYFVNGTTVNGKRTASFRGTGSSGYPSFQTVDESMVISNDTLKVEISGSKVWNWEIGNTSASISDDKMVFSRIEMSGKATEGTPFSLKHTADVTLKFNCSWPESGKVRIQPDFLSPRDIDYGSGSCDGAVSINLNGVIYNYTIK